MTKHLSSKHALKYQEAKDAREKETTRPNMAQQSQPSTSVSNLAAQVPAPEAERPKTLMQQSVKTCIEKKMAYSVGSPRKHALDNLIAQFVVLDMQPFSVVEDRGFQTLMNAMDPRYSLPSRRELTRTLIPNFYREEFANLKEELNDAEFITLTTDDWTSRSTKGYMAVTAHFVNNHMQLKSKIIEIRRITSSQTADRIAEELQGVMSAWDITTKVFAIVTDNAANMVAAIKKLPVYHVPCFAHTLNLVVQDSLNNLRTLSSARGKVRAIVSHFHHSSKAAYALSEEQRRETEAAEDNVKIQGPKKLTQEVRTRWNSTFHMLERFLELQQPVRRVLADELRDDLQQTREELLIIQDAVAALKPFDEVTKEMSAEKTTSISKVIPIIRGLGETLRQMETSPVACELREQLLQKRFPNPEDSTLWGIATFLDPRFMKHVFSGNDAVEAVKTKILQLFPKPKEPTLTETTMEQCLSQQARASAAPTSSIWSFVDSTVAKQQKTTEKPTVKPYLELSKYEKESPIWREEDPLMWWKLHGATMQELQKIAKKFLACPATSTPSERLFSKAGELVNQRRSNISDSNINMVLFLNKNLS